MQQVTILDSSYEIRDNFDPYDYLTQAWGVMGGDERMVVKLRFSPNVAYRVRESDWPCVDAIDDLPDGGCLMTLTVSHTLEMKPWIRGWGADCEVIDRQSFPNHSQAKLAIFSCIEGWYNPHRRHSSIAYHAPIAYEKLHLSQA